VRLPALLAVVTVLAAVPSAGSAAARPDLVVGSLTYAHGATLSVTETTVNRGGAAAKRSFTAVYLSKDAVKSAGDKRLGSHAVKALKKKRSARTTSRVTLPVLSPGSYRVLACADAKATIKESREKNNCRAAARPLIVAPPGGAPQYTLTVGKMLTGDGTITSSPAGIDCGATCTATFPAGTVVTLTATPHGNSRFTAWNGTPGCAVAPTCTITMDGDRTATAIFELPGLFVGAHSVGESSPYLNANGSYGPVNNVDYAVKLDTAAPGPVTVNYATVAGTATADVDFESVSGQLVFAPGETEKHVQVRVLRDLIDEPTEDFTFRLSDAQGAAVMTQGTTTISDDDVACDGDDTSSPDDTFALARDLTASSSTTISGAKLCLNDADNFKLRVPAGNQLTATVTPTGSFDPAVGVYTGSEFVSLVSPLAFADLNGDGLAETTQYTNNGSSDQTVVVRVANTLTSASGAGDYTLQFAIAP
jgi:hypothetical protein